MKTSEVVAPKHYSETLPAPWAWTKERGPIPGWYSDKAAGSRFFAAARWIVRPGGRDVGTLSVLQVEGETSQMSWERLYYEALDIVQGLKPWGDHLARELVGCTPDMEPPSRRPIEALVDENRRLHSEYIAPWCVADLVGVALMGFPQRPGWELLPADLALLRQAKPGVGIWRRV